MDHQTDERDFVPDPDLGDQPPAPVQPELELTDIQRVVVYGLGHHPYSHYALVRIDSHALCKSWLTGALKDVAPQSPHGVYAAIADHQATLKGVRLTLAFTFSGLRRLGLDRKALASFVPEFREGITAPHRARILGDQGKNDNRHWDWGQWEQEVCPERRQEHEAKQVHMLVGAHASTRAILADWVETAWADPAALGFHVVRTLRAEVQDFEPFGFRDGLSQPYIEGSGRPTHKVADRDRIAAGEFILGYANGFGRFSESPIVATDLDPENRLRRSVTPGFKDLGRNGTFLVVRELVQNVAAFNRLPERLRVGSVGRWPNGVPLVLRPMPLDPKSKVDTSPADSVIDKNDFAYFREDAAGLRCPLGAHIRRSNPRDHLANPSLGTSPEDAIALANHHRILRRSRVFTREDGETGILFQCINTNLERQFEFVQQTWINNVKFAGAYEERDPMTGSGPGHDLTLTRAPERVRGSDLLELQDRRGPNLHQFVTVRGGAYFFLPGLRALKYLSELL